MIQVSYAFGPIGLSVMVVPQQNGEPEKADLSHMVKFLSDDGNVFLFYLRSGIMSLSKMC